MNKNISPRIGATIIFTLIGLIFPPSFIVAALFAVTVFADLVGPFDKASTAHDKLKDLTDKDKGWCDRFRAVCESPAETAFLDAMGAAFDLKPVNGILTGRGLNMQMQIPVSCYRLDFLVDKRLVVEIDGAKWHSSPEAVERDKKRDIDLREMGYEILRIAAKFPLYSPSEAVECVKRARLIVASQDEEKAKFIRDRFRPSQILNSLNDALTVASDGISAATRAIALEAELADERNRLLLEQDIAKERQKIQDELEGNEKRKELFNEVRKRFENSRG